MHRDSELIFEAYEQDIRHISEFDPETYMADEIHPMAYPMKRETDEELMNQIKSKASKGNFKSALYDLFRVLYSSYRKNRKDEEAVKQGYASILEYFNRQIGPNKTKELFFSFKDADDESMPNKAKDYLFKYMMKPEEMEEIYRISEERAIKPDPHEDVESGFMPKV